MSWYDRIKQRDQEIADRLAGSEAYFSLSPTRLSLSRVLLPRAKQYLRGTCLDAGAGRSAYAPVLRACVQQYIAMDIKPDARLSLTGSVMDLPLRPASLDSLFCSQVLEHVPEPQRALHQFFNALKPGAYLVVSVPHLAYLHNEPHDYFRFTPHGLRHLCQQASLDVVHLEPAGGLLAFLGHIPSIIVKALTAGIPGLGGMVRSANRIYSRAVVWVDTRIEKRKLFALNYVLVARKPENADA